MMLRLVGVNVSDAWQLSNDFVHAWVVLHGAGTQRIEAGIDAKVTLGKPRVMADHFRLRKARPASRLLSNKAVRNGWFGGGLEWNWLTVSSVFSAVVIEQVAHAFTSPCVVQRANWAESASISPSDV